jgi:hypothetical protein
VLALLFGTLVAGGEAHKSPLVSGVVGLVFGAATVLVILRFGVLALGAAFTVESLIETFPLTSDWSRWYAEGASVALVLVAALAIYGLWVSVGRRPGTRPPPSRA